MAVTFQLLITLRNTPALLICLACVTWYIVISFVYHLFVQSLLPGFEQCIRLCINVLYIQCFFGRLYSDLAETDSPVVMFHQSKWQQHILSRYGNCVCLLDATYNTTSYAMPLYMLSCLTNFGYVVVGEFLLTDDQTTSIQEGLATMSRLNPQWKPLNFISDFSEAQIAAVLRVFPG